MAPVVRPRHWPEGSLLQCAGVPLSWHRPRGSRQRLSTSLPSLLAAVAPRGMRAAVTILVAMTTLTGASDCTPDVLSQYTSGWPAKLDFGIYWFGKNDEFEKATSAEASRFYDPKKPTLVYFHGWTGVDDGWVATCTRATSRCVNCPEGAPLLFDGFLDAGWNVGIFYWDQFADEDCTRDAEQKVWFDRHGNGIRWKSYNVTTGTFSYETMQPDGSDFNLAKVSATAVKSVLSNFKGQTVRFVGHSIGSQLAAEVASLLHEEDHPAKPQRLALLEPFFTRHQLYFFRCKEFVGKEQGVGSFTAEATASTVRQLWDKSHMMTEIYKSSLLTQKPAMGYPNKELAEVGTVVLYKPNWCGGDSGLLTEVAHLQCYHNAIIPLYFLRFGIQPAPLNPPQVLPDVMPGSAIANCSTPSAACSDLEIREWVDRQNQVDGTQLWQQTTGQETFDPMDDSFALAPALNYAGEDIVSRDAMELYMPHANDHASRRHSLAGMRLPLWAPVAIGGAAAAAVVFFGCVCLVCRTRRRRGTESDVDSEDDFESGLYGGSDHGRAVSFSGQARGYE
eukprot:TRINITY_DN123129_c0_g1_i1.p1 TRINITY_DN123129_c0_g1~~TRINITY_DN123129_c0_g1_i1.p1  ORF type:complete len:562 (+),score=104.32 TRINITY_DN123129_c0_g1_i1:67-1752(+)